LLLNVNGINKLGVFVEGCPPSVNKLIIDELSPWIVADDSSTTSIETCLNIQCSVGSPEYIRVSKNGSTLAIQESNSSSLFHVLRRAIRQGLFYSMEVDGWVQIHAGAVALPNRDVILFVGEKGAGKTSSVLGTCRNLQSLSFVTNDRILIHKDRNWVIGWPTGVGIGKEALLRLNINISGYQYDGKTWYWPSQLRMNNFPMLASGTIRMVVMPHFTLHAQEEIRITNLFSSTLLKSNIRYDALQEDNWWNIKRPDSNSYGQWLLSTQWIKDLPAIKIQSSGLCQPYLNALFKEVGI